MKFGKDLAYLLLIAKDNPDDIPAPLLSQPELPEATAAALQAFLFLSECRSHNGYSPNPITVSDMMAYVVVNPICDGLRFFGLIRSLDRVFLDWHAAKAKDAAK